MVAYSFQPRFVAPILLGIKQQTIRGDRKRHARPGDQLQLFTGMRTRQCRRIGTATCSMVERVHLDLVNHLVTVGDFYRVERTELDEWARKDGFRDWIAMRAFWSPQDGFEGWLIRWCRFVPDMEQP